MTSGGSSALGDGERPPPGQRIDVSLFADLAVDVWRGLGGRAPHGVEVVGSVRRKKCALLRLVGATERGGSVIAKLCRDPSTRFEPIFYERVLPGLPVTSPRCYGTRRESEGVWLFLEDVGARQVDARAPAERILVARWLASLHSAASRKPLQDLPDRGPAHYLEHLSSARRAILDNLGNPAFEDGHRSFLESVLVQYEELETRWDEIEDVCVQVPRTLVHGDFRPKNLHVRTNAAGLELFALDWEMAGWGVPAVDLYPRRKEPKAPLSDLAVYGAAMRAHWPELDRLLLRRMVYVGRVFRQLAATSWASEDLPYRWPESPLSRMRLYHSELAAALRERWAL